MLSVGHNGWVLRALALVDRSRRDPETALVNATLDANGNGHTWGVVTYTDAATGVTCTGTTRGKITNALATLTLVARLREREGGLFSVTLSVVTP